MDRNGRRKTIYTIGHSNRTMEAFILLLNEFEIEIVADVRTIPKSRNFPHFNRESLKACLKQYSIDYRHLKELGGFRRPMKSSVNTGWRNDSFRGFADYMQSESFKKGMEKLEKMALKKRTTILCSEALPWRCHRSLISDILTLNNWEVFNIQGKNNMHLHKLTPFLKINRGNVIYPKETIEE